MGIFTKYLKTNRKIDINPLKSIALSAIEMGGPLDGRDVISKFKKKGYTLYSNGKVWNGKFEKSKDYSDIQGFTIHDESGELPAVLKAIYHGSWSEKGTVYNIMYEVWDKSTFEKMHRGYTI